MVTAPVITLGPGRSRGFDPVRKSCTSLEEMIVWRNPN